jgi:uncharacterized protein
MRFWDSSALVALFVAQQATAAVRELLASDPQVLAWTLSDVEIRSALARMERQGALELSRSRDVALRVERFWESVHVVTLIDVVKARAKRLLGVHALKAADALQLGAALAAASDDPSGLELVCLDERLCDAARREGFSVTPSLS